MKAVTTMPPFPVDGSVKTLGWEAVAWVETYLGQPDGDNAGEPYRLTPEQLSFLLYFYAVDDAGRFTYRRAVLRRSKGWGKSPFMGALCLLELLGPVRFGGWDAHGEPVAVPVAAPWVNLAGVSLDQTANTMSVILAMIEQGTIADHYDLDPGLTRIYVPGGGRLLPITASSATQEGARPTFALMDETHHWNESNGGRALANVIRRNLAKVNGRSVETTNAHAPGQDSVAEGSFLAYLAIKEGRTRADGLLYDSREAPADIDLSDPDLLLRGLELAYGDSAASAGGWVDLERIREEVYDPATPPEDARRFYLNQIVAAADSWVTPAEWEANRRDDLEPLAEGQQVTLGFDGGRTDDSSALVAVRVSDGAAFLLGLWEKPEGPAGIGWEVDQDTVRETVDYAFDRFDVVAFFSDVAYWETSVDLWRETYGERLLIKATTRHSVAWDMRAHQQETVRAIEALNRAIVEGEVPFPSPDADPMAARLTRHVLNARRRPNRWGVGFGKESRESPRKVDALAALLLARMARTRVLGEGALTKRKRPGAFVSF